jgi:hypothetical protein
MELNGTTLLEKWAEMGLPLELGIVLLPLHRALESTTRNRTTARMNGWGPLYFPFGCVALAKHILEWLGVPVANSDDLCGAKGGVPVMSPSPGLKKVGQRYLLDFPVIVQSPGLKKMNRRHLMDF